MNEQQIREIAETAFKRQFPDVKLARVPPNQPASLRPNARRPHRRRPGANPPPLRPNSPPGIRHPRNGGIVLVSQPAVCCAIPPAIPTAPDKFEGAA